MQQEYPEHLIYKWTTERLDKAVIKFCKTFIVELQYLVLTDYGLINTLSDGSDINLSTWAAQTSKDFPIFTLKFRKEPIAGPDFRQFQLFQMRQMAYGITPHPIIANLEECKREKKTANILGIGVVNDEGTSIGPLNLEVVWTNAEAVRLFKNVNLSKEQAMVLAADAVKAGKGIIRKY